MWDCRHFVSQSLITTLTCVSSNFIIYTVRTVPPTSRSNISKVRCECGHLNHKPALYEKGNYYFRPDLSNTPTIDILAQWKYVIEEYSFLDITKKSDRLPALSGIATLFAPHLGGEYLAGLWKQDIEKLLSWEYVQKLNKIFKRAKPYVAPTWYSPFHPMKLL